ncbi:hypothetical protein GUJ93_ZPchr0004g40036 [Zizania palustris]|uniref:Uncharacterized protein n=1 Tax=Zizania palustris TaxID=103762 RepID=A0A8J5S195_ZIZPA|nr:hypothetical protein GUJ93_ZPchr0004g40036 [Zizania palustris]
MTGVKGLLRGSQMAPEAMVRVKGRLWETKRHFRPGPGLITGILRRCHLTRDPKPLRTQVEGPGLDGEAESEGTSEEACTL